MEKVKKKGKVERNIIGYVWVYAILVCIVMLIVDKGSFILPVSFLLGTFTNLLCFTITIKSVDKIIYDEKLNVKSEYLKANIRKMVIYGVVLGLAAYSFWMHGDKALHLNFYATAAGFFSVKLMIYFKMLIIDKIFHKGEDEESSVTPVEVIVDKVESQAEVQDSTEDLENVEKKEDDNDESNS